MDGHALHAVPHLQAVGVQEMSLNIFLLEGGFFSDFLLLPLFSLPLVN